jgi:AraC-like DNA-binding protein/quercetin dioxygenase-like cupin family protein
VAVPEDRKSICVFRGDTRRPDGSSRSSTVALAGPPVHSAALRTGAVPEERTRQFENPTIATRRGQEARKSRPHVQNRRAVVRSQRQPTTQGDVEARNMVGRCYEQDSGVAANPKRATEPFEIASRAGHVWGQVNLPQVGSSDRRPHDIPRPVAALGIATTLAKTQEVGVHHHRKAQLILTLSGVVTCQVDDSVCIVRSAVWIPSGVPHGFKASGNVRIYCLFVEPDAAATLPGESCTVTVSPLLQELMLRVVELPELYDVAGQDGRLANVLLDELSIAPVEKLDFPMPSDAKLRKIANAMMAAPSDRATIAQWGRRVGAAERTLTRILLRETGMSFGRWRQQLQILIALQRLGEGTPVQTVAEDLGYESASAFITMFRKTFGKPPARYLAERHISQRSAAHIARISQ